MCLPSSWCSCDLGRGCGGAGKGHVALRLRSVGLQWSLRGGSPRQEGSTAKMRRGGAGVPVRGTSPAWVHPGCPLLPPVVFPFSPSPSLSLSYQPRPSGVCLWLGLPVLKSGGKGMSPCSRTGTPVRGGPRPERGPKMLEIITALTAKSPKLRCHVLAHSRLWAHDGRRPCLQGSCLTDTHKMTPE